MVFTLFRVDGRDKISMTISGILSSKKGVEMPKQNDMHIVKQLVGYISTWLYSDDVPPDPINDLFLRWMDKGKVPSSGELTLAIRQSDEILSRRQVGLH